MKPEPPDDKEALLEQWLGGVLAIAATILFFGILIWIAFSRIDAAECKIVWDNPPDQVSKWRVHLGLVVLTEVTTPAATLILPDAPCEIAVIAVNAYGLISEPATLKLAFYTDQEGNDMLAWINLRSYHREFIAGRRFNRIKIETPP